MSKKKDQFDNQWKIRGMTASFIATLSMTLGLFIGVLEMILAQDWFGIVNMMLLLFGTFFGGLSWMQHLIKRSKQ